MRNFNLQVDGKIFWGKGAPKQPEDEGYPDVLRSLEELIPHVISIQSTLSSLGIPSYLTGGVAIDLIGSQQFHDHQARTHKDIDILIPRWALFRIASPDALPHIGFSDFKPWNALNHDKDGFVAMDHTNLRVFTNSQEIRLDMMGYVEIGATGFIPKMTWGGKVNMASAEGMIFSIQPYMVNLFDSAITTVHPIELEKMLRSLNMIKQNEPNKRFDLQVLKRINAL